MWENGEFPWKKTWLRCSAGRMRSERIFVSWWTVIWPAFSAMRWVRRSFLFWSPISNSGTQDNLCHGPFHCRVKTDTSATRSSGHIWAFSTAGAMETLQNDPRIWPNVWLRSIFTEEGETGWRTCSSQCEPQWQISSRFWTLGKGECSWRKANQAFSVWAWPVPKNSVRSLRRRAMTAMQAAISLFDDCRV